MNIIELIEAVAAKKLSYEEAMDHLDTMDITKEQWTNAELALQHAMDFEAICPKCGLASQYCEGHEP